MTALESMYFALTGARAAADDRPDEVEMTSAGTPGVPE
jgi:hypothetical protein